MHIEADLLDDVETGERQVLEDLGKASELSRISNRRLESGGELRLRVHGHRDRLAVHHASALTDVKSELALSEEESICLMLYGDPQKMVKRAEVLHGEFPLKGRYGMLHERCARCGEHNIKQQVYHIGVVVEGEQGGVGLGLNKSQSEEVRGKSVVVSPTSTSACRETC
jgi:hypothetical protein